MPQNPAPALRDRLRAAAFHAFPHHAVSRIFYWLTRRETTLRKPVVRWFVRVFNVDMSEALEPDPTHYPNFNAFFVRELKPGARPVSGGENDIVSPADGVISQIGAVSGGRIVQAKGQSFTATELLGGDHTLAEPFQSGLFCTIYLSPRDYHRVHMPRAGQLLTMVHVPGRLFTVAPYATSTIPRLFARNERVVALFSEHTMPMAVVLVGAVNVSAIETVWAGLVTPPRGKHIVTTNYNQGQDQAIHIDCGAEMGRFNMGSTVILLFAKDSADWDESLRAGDPIRLGQRLGTMRDIMRAPTEKP